jgi:hypothetical protein
MTIKVNGEVVNLDFKGDFPAFVKQASQNELTSSPAAFNWRTTRAPLLRSVRR